MLQTLMDIPEEKKQTIRDIFRVLNVYKSSLGWLVKQDPIKHTTVSVKLFLNEINKIKRVAFALE